MSNRAGIQVVALTIAGVGQTYAPIHCYGSQNLPALIGCHVGCPEEIQLGFDKAASTVTTRPAFEWDDTCDEPPQRDRAVATMQIPLRKSQGATRELLEEYVTQAATDLQIHRHTYTCKKGGRLGGHEDCRMGYDRPLVQRPCLLENGSVLLRRTHGMLVPYIAALILASPCNHYMSLALESSRYVRDLLLWYDARCRGDTQVR